MVSPRLYQWLGFRSRLSLRMSFCNENCRPDETFQVPVTEKTKSLVFLKKKDTDDDLAWDSDNKIGMKLT